ncbi:hypothetical protein BOTCAL_0632g00030 [Botryotinia calthae]|uniref:Uncharacterized protein n=1 Tax=Botryotinia calthae TaxID=38488 RepID=A0A4Y8CIA0_9HELO|nr:hypothetical protein BOTCAL_0632g00030 [Botryotinia calthae]
MGFQAYRDNAPMQTPMLKLKHHSIFSWEEGSIEQRGFTNEESDLGTPSKILHSAGLTKSISFADKIADAHIYRPREQKADRGISLRDATVDESHAGMRSKSKLTCGWCEMDPSVSTEKSERAWANLPTMLKHQHSGLHAPKPRNRHGLVHIHVAEHELTVEKTGCLYETTDTVPQRSVQVRNTDVTSNGGPEDGEGKRNIKSTKTSKNDDTWCTWLRDPECSNDVEWPILSFSEAITDRHVERNQMPRGSNDECDSLPPPSFASLECLEEALSDPNFLSSPEHGIRTTDPSYDLDVILIGEFAPGSTTGNFVESQPNLISFENMTSESSLTEDWQDRWIVFGESGGTLLDGW